MNARTRKMRAKGGAVSLSLFGYWVLLDTWPLLTIIASVLATATAGTYAVRRHGQHWALRMPRTRRGARTTQLPLPRSSRQRTAHWPTDPYVFEQAIADLAQHDPHVRRATAQGGSNDRTLDVLVELHSGEKIHIQCKRYAPSKAVPVETVYAVNGTYRGNDCAQAVIVTTSRFTPSAVAEAQRDGIRLIDGPALADWAAGGAPPWN